MPSSTGTAVVEITATSDGKTYTTDPLTLDLSFRKMLTPNVTGILDGVHFVNDPIEVDGDGFLLGGDEGQSIARITGCFQPDAGGGCAPIAQQSTCRCSRSTTLSRTKAQCGVPAEDRRHPAGHVHGPGHVVNQQAGGGEVDGAGDRRQLHDGHLAGVLRRSAGREPGPVRVRPRRRVRRRRADRAHRARARRARSTRPAATRRRCRCT